MEESLRNYFIIAGYYVVRGVPFSYEGFEVTDIDLWLYGRASSVSREITIVDIKNKRTPKAIERIFWVQGLKHAVKATNAIVATTEKNPAVKNFGRELGVMILDGSFLAKLARSEPEANRLTDEEFLAKVDEYPLEKMDGGWKNRIRSCKSLFSKELSFDSCNQWLVHAKFFAEQSITHPRQNEISLRCLYLICSFIVIAIDFSLKELSFLDQPARVNAIKDGFTYGKKGGSGMKRILDVAMGLVEEHADNGSLISNQVRTSVERQLSSLNTLILGEFFAKTDVSRKLLPIAREFEQLAMQSEFSSHTNASVDLRGVLFCFFDYWGISRTMFTEHEGGE